MSVEEKILRSLKSSAAHLDDSILALSKEDEVSFANSLWYAAGELEYALFLFSMKFQDRNDTSKWEPKSDAERNEAVSLLRAARVLLDESKRAVAEGMLLDAHKSAYVARCYLFRVQEDLAKRKREAFGKK
jgi:hypothetical protein